MPYAVEGSRFKVQSRICHFVAGGFDSFESLCWAAAKPLEL
jgi:hypothetical protein